MSDLVIQDGDLVINNKDLQVHLTEEDSVAASIIRRIKTNANQYAIKYLADKIYTELDTQYGTDIVNSLASPIDKVTELVKRQVELVARQEPRIIVNSVSTYLVNEYTVKAKLDYTYKQKSYTLEV